MKNIFEEARLLEEIKNTEMTRKDNYFKPNYTTNKEKPQFTYSENVKKTLGNLKLNTDEKYDMPRPEKTIGKESQRKGKGRGCM